jgi:hypothetical protein
MKKLTLRITEKYMFKTNEASILFGEDKYTKSELKPNFLTNLYNDVYIGLMSTFPMDLKKTVQKRDKDIYMCIEDIDTKKVINCTINNNLLEGCEKMNIDCLNVSFSQLMKQFN